MNTIGARESRVTDNNHVVDNEYGYWQGQIETRVQSAEMRSDEIKASVKEVEVKVITRLDVIAKLLTEHIQGQTLYNVQNDARLKLVESWNISEAVGAEPLESLSMINKTLNI